MSVRDPAQAAKQEKHSRACRIPPESGSRRLQAFKVDSRSTGSVHTFAARTAYNGAMLLDGVFAAVTTPFYPDERLYLRKLEHNIARYSRTLLAGMVVLGSTGEAVSLTDEESRSVLRMAAETAAPEKVLIAGVGRESVAATMELVEHAAALDYDAVLVRNPAYYRPQLSPAAQLQFFRMIADRSPLPVLLYSIPRFTEFEIPLEVVAELSSHPNIWGIKESSGSVDRIRDLVQATRLAPRRTVTVTTIFEAVTARMLRPVPASGGDGLIPAESLAGGVAAPSVVAPALKTRTREVGFQVLTGSVGNLKESLDAGASGAVLAFAACAPQACQEIYSAWKEHDEALALAKQLRIADAAAFVGNRLGVAGVKYACDWNGYFGGRARSPLLALDAATRMEIETRMATIRS